MKAKYVLFFLVSLLLTAGLALAQEPGKPAQPAEPSEPLNAFSLFVDGGSFLGVYAEDINNTNMSKYGLREVRGVGVTEVAKNSPAEKAGLKKGDVIVRFDNESVTSVRKLTRLVSETAPDHTVKLGISREGSEQEVAVTLAKRDETANTIFQGRMPGGVFNFPQGGFPELGQIEQGRSGLLYALGNNRRIGVSTQSLTKQLADYFGIADGKGVLVTSVEADSPAAKAGIKAGDVITAIDGEKVEAAGDLSRAINRQKEGEVTLTIVRDKKERTIKVTPTKAETPRIRTTVDQQAIRAQVRDAIRRGAAEGRIVIPQIDLPSIPAVNVTVPRIELPVIPRIEIMIPTVPRVRVKRTTQPVLI